MAETSARKKLVSRADISNDWRRPAASEVPGTSTSSYPSRTQKFGTRRSDQASPKDGETSYQRVRTAWHSTEKPSPSSNDVDYSKRMYLGNLVYFATEEDIKSLLDGYDYLNISLSVDPFTSRNPSYCYIDLTTPEEVERAIRELNGKMLLKRPVKTGPAVAPRSRSANREQTASSSASSNQNDASASAEAQPSPFAYDRWRKAPSEALRHAFPAAGSRLWVGTLPSFELHPPTVQRNIRQFFEDNGFHPTAISKIVPPPKERQRPDGLHHYLFVDLEDSDTAARALEALQQKVPPWGSTPPKVDMASPAASWKVHQREDFMDLHQLKSAID